MQNHIIETSYPISFRKEDALLLGERIRNRQNVSLIGMKRVGISSFLRFFLYHKNIRSTYIKDKNKHLFIPVDLYDLDERETYPFWVLVFKRVVDSVETTNLSSPIKKQIEQLFLDSLQSKDLFLLIEALRKALLRIIENDFYPTIFLIRFDRMSGAITPELFTNLRGLREATHHVLSYVFTSFNSLDQIYPEVVQKFFLNTFLYESYLLPTKKADTKVVLDSLIDRFKVESPKYILSKETTGALLWVVDGHNQYLQLALIILHETGAQFKNGQSLLEFLVKDERIILQSEELWDVLNKDEQNILAKVAKEEKLTLEEKNNGKYLWLTRYLFEEGSKVKIFNPLFEQFVIQAGKNETSTIEFSRKENLLFAYLKHFLAEVCERENIIQAVWPEEESLGISDWAMDRLVARVRNKLKQQNSIYEIVTIKTRGFKLIAS